MEKLKSFNIDFNWLEKKCAPANVFSNADVVKLVDWYEKLGCNNFWTFAVSFNGYAWYDSKLSPKIEGLKGNFTKDCVIEGHKRGMSVFAYHCLGDNPVVAKKYPSWRRNSDLDYITMIFCDEYIDWFCEAIKESISECDYDGLVIDCFRCPKNRSGTWDEKEIDLYNLLMDTPYSVDISDAQIDEFNKRTIQRAWTKIKTAVKSVKDIPIWTNQPFDFADDPVWNGNILMKEADYILNECPDFSLLEWLKKESGPNTCIVQNLCGWADHDLSSFTKEVSKDIGLFGFAAADPNTCLPYTKDNCVDDISTSN